MVTKTFQGAMQIGLGQEVEQCRDSLMEINGGLLVRTITTMPVYVNIILWTRQ